MTELDYHLHRYNEITKELTRLNTITRELRKQKKDARDKLYDHMRTHGLTNYKGMKIDKISPPKEKKKSKTKTQREKDAVAILTSLGVGDAKNIWQRIENEPL
jgi:hypothetical protein